MITTIVLIKAEPKHIAASPMACSCAASLPGSHASSASQCATSSMARSSAASPVARHQSYRLSLMVSCLVVLLPAVFRVATVTLALIFFFLRRARLIAF